MSTRLVLLIASLVTAAACGSGSSSPIGPSPGPAAQISLTVSSATTERRDDGNLSYAIAFQIRGTSAGVTATVSTLTVVLSAANNFIAAATVPAAEVLSTTRIAGATSAQFILRVQTDSAIQATYVTMRVDYIDEAGNARDGEGDWDVTPVADPSRLAGAL